MNQPHSIGPDLPFQFTHGPSDPERYLRQRMVFQHVSREQNADRLFVEEAVLSILGDVTGLAYERQGVTRAAGRGGVATWIWWNQRAT